MPLLSFRNISKNYRATFFFFAKQQATLAVML